MGNVITTSTNSFEASKLLQFQNNFERILQKTDSKFLASNVIRHLDIKGISNLSRIDGDELQDVTGTRNPQKQVIEMKTDNRRSVAYRFTRTYRVDSYDKAVTLITDPTQDLFRNLAEAKNRTIDRLVAQSASAPVIVGAPDTAGTQLSAEDDGVVTIDCTSKFSYKTAISPAITKFENHYVDCSTGCTLAISNYEKQALRDDEYYMNSLYSGNNTVDKGTITNVSGFNIVSFAGSEQGGETVTDPVLKENNGVRTNILFAPQSVAFAIELGRLDAERANGYVNSWDITIDVWFKAVRTQGAKIILLKSTI